MSSVGRRQEQDSYVVSLMDSIFNPVKLLLYSHSLSDSELGSCEELARVRVGGEREVLQYSVSVI